MWPFAKKGDMESKIDMLDYTLRDSFQRVRNDMDTVNVWLNYFYNQELERQRAMETLQSRVAHLSTTKALPQEIPDTGHMQARLKKVEQKVDELGVSVHAVEPIVGKIAALNSKVQLVEESQKNIFERLREISSKVDKFENKVEQTRTRTSLNLREKIVRKVAKHSKEYVKNLIISTIAKYDEISALQIREMIVEEQGLCSKSTFYRILEEIEQEHKVSMISKGKEKVYMPKVLAKH
jgi:hypothetical protein